MKGKSDHCRSADPFKRCTLCMREWSTLDEFLNVRDNHFDGYQYVSDRVREGLPAEGLLIFTHRHGDCGTSLAILASRFKSSEPSRSRRR